MLNSWTSKTSNQLEQVGVTNILPNVSTSDISGTLHNASFFSINALASSLCPAISSVYSPHRHGMVLPLSSRHQTHDPKLKCHLIVTSQLKNKIVPHPHTDNATANHNTITMFASTK